jgi:hypothetical protein
MASTAPPSSLPAAPCTSPPRARPTRRRSTTRTARRSPTRSRRRAASSTSSRRHRRLGRSLHHGAGRSVRRRGPASLPAARTRSTSHHEAGADVQDPVLDRGLGRQHREGHRLRLPGARLVLDRCTAGVNVTTLDAGQNILFGILSTESGGDADGLSTNVSLTTAVQKIAVNGALFSTNAPHMSDSITGKSISYTLDTSTDTGKGFIQLPYGCLTASARTRDETRPGLTAGPVAFCLTSQPIDPWLMPSRSSRKPAKPRQRDLLVLDTTATAPPARAPTSRSSKAVKPFTFEPASRCRCRRRSRSSSSSTTLQAGRREGQCHPVPRPPRSPTSLGAGETLTLKETRPSRATTSSPPLRCKPRVLARCRAASSSPTRRREAARRDDPLHRRGQARKAKANTSRDGDVGRRRVRARSRTDDEDEAA